MDKLLITVFFVLMAYIIFHQSKSSFVVVDEPTHEARHTIREVLNSFSSGDKINILNGDCLSNIYTRNTLDVTMESKFTKILNKIFQSIHGLTEGVYKVQEINNLYEQLDGLGNGRYIVDASLYSVNNFYSIKVVLDVVLLQGDLLVNTVTINDASNNNIINRYDIVYQDTGILNQTNSFTESMKGILDNQYKRLDKLISIDTRKLDSVNYKLDNVLSLESLLNKYYPASVSNKTVANLEMKGIDGLAEQYFPNNLVTINSPQFCDKFRESCIFQHNTTTTRYTQPYMAPGLFFDRSSLPAN
tara:strand:- start:374 stop:1279 length:906 start_codon:yes stop_codon:yes gene_type:complete